MGSLKKKMKKAVISSEFCKKAMVTATGSYPKIFMYHRFCRKGNVSSFGISSDTFRWQLEKIIEHYRVWSFGDCIQHYIANGRWPARCAVITIDDGYRDFYEFAYPELRRLNLPATFFVTVNFIMQKIWLWPDRLHYALDKTVKSDFQIDIKGQLKIFTIKDQASKTRAWKTLIDCCIMLDDIDKVQLIGSVEKALAVNLPELPTDDYAAANWRQLVEMLRNGIEIGSHTMNHPILSRINREDLDHEVKESRAVLEDRLQAPVYTFCYPNGQPGDINKDIVNAVKSAGYIGAPYWLDMNNWDPFLMPRIGVSNDRDEFLSKLYGLELVGQKLNNLQKKSHPF